MGNKKRKNKKPEWINHSTTGGGGTGVWYDGDPTDLDPGHMETMEEAAKFAIDVYNRTHLIKYNFVNVKIATRDKMILYMLLTATRRADEDDDEKNPITFLAWVNVGDKYVKRIEIVRRTDLLCPDGFPREAGTEMDYWESGDHTRCDDKTMDILKKLAALAIQSCEETRDMRYGLVEVLLATGHSSAGSVVDLIFTAKPHSLYMRSNSAITLQARVSLEHMKVEFVDCIYDNDAVSFR